MFDRELHGRVGMAGDRGVHDALMFGIEVAATARYGTESLR